MYHTILTAWVSPVAVFFPWSLFDQVLKRCVMRIRHQVARPLPSAWIERGVTPGGAHHVALSGEKFEIDGRSHQVEPFEQVGRLAKLLADVLARHKNFFR